MKKNKIGLFGGSFNPIHNAHIEVSKIIFKKLELDELFFIPTFVSPHKLNQEHASSKDRIEMINLAINEKNEFRVCDYETKKNSISYTIDTIDFFNSKYSTSELFFLAGSDVIKKLESWYKINEIFEKCNFIIFNRPNNQPIDLLIENSMLTKEQKFSILKNKINIQTDDISSTEIRLYHSNGRNIKKFLPNNVYDYIIDKELYKNNK